MEWEKISANYTSEKGLISKIHKELIQLNSQHTQTYTTGSEDAFFKRRQTNSQQVRRCSISLIIRKCKPKSLGNITSHFLEWPQWKIQAITNAGVHVEKREPLWYYCKLVHCRWWLQPWNEKTLTPWKESYDQPRQHIKKQTLLCQQRSISLRLWFFQ